MDKAILITNASAQELKDLIIEGIKAELKSAKSEVETSGEELLTRKETAQFLKISLVCLHDWCNKEILKPYKIGNRTYFIKNEVIKTLLNSNTSQDGSSFSN